MFLDFAIPPPALSGSGSRSRANGSPLSLAHPGSPCDIFVYGEYKRLLQNVKNGFKAVIRFYLTQYRLTCIIFTPTQVKCGRRPRYGIKGQFTRFFNYPIVKLVSVAQKTGTWSLRDPLKRLGILSRGKFAYARMGKRMVAWLLFFIGRRSLAQRNSRRLKNAPVR